MKGIPRWRLKSLQIGDAVQEIGVLVKHEFVALAQNRKEPPPCFDPVLHAASLERNALSFVSPGLLRELNRVFPVLKASELHHNEKVVGHTGVC